MDQISISRRMNKNDIPAVARLEQACFAAPWSSGALRSELKNRLAHYQVIVQGGDIRAYAGMWLVLPEAYITNVAVHPAYRRQGYGRRIMLEMMHAARAAGALCMTLEVRKSNLAAQALYAALGFVQAGARRGYYRDNGEDALILWNDDIGATLDKNGGGRV